MLFEEALFYSHIERKAVRDLQDTDPDMPAGLLLSGLLLCAAVLVFPGLLLCAAGLIFPGLLLWACCCAPPGWSSPACFDD